MSEVDLSEFIAENGDVDVQKLIDKFYDSGILLFKDPRFLPLRRLLV